MSGTMSFRVSRGLDNKFQERRTEMEISEELLKKIEEYIEEHYIPEETDEEYEASVYQARRERYLSKGEEDAAESPLWKGERAREGDITSESDNLWKAEHAGKTQEAEHAREAGEVRSSEGEVLQPKRLDISAVIPAGKSRKSQNLQDVIKHVGETFQERLLRLIDEKGLTDPEVYKKANIDRKLFSKIRCTPDYKPRKRTVIALAVALELNLDETVDLLGRAEMALSPGSKADLIVEYCISNQIYDIYEINTILLKYDQPLLGQ